VKPLYIGNDVYIDSNIIFCIMSAWHPKAKKTYCTSKERK